MMASAKVASIVMMATRLAVLNRVGEIISEARQGERDATDWNFQLAATAFLPCCLRYEELMRNYCTNPIWNSAVPVDLSG